MSSRLVVLVCPSFFQFFKACANLWRQHVTHLDLGATLGCHGIVTEIKACFFFFFFFHLFTYFFARFGRFACFGGFVSLISVVSFRSFRLFQSFHFVVSGFSTCQDTEVDIFISWHSGHWDKAQKIYFVTKYGCRANSLNLVHLFCDNKPSLVMLLNVCWEHCRLLSSCFLLIHQNKIEGEKSINSKCNLNCRLTSIDAHTSLRLEKKNHFNLHVYLKGQLPKFH